MWSFVSECSFCTVGGADMGKKSLKYKLGGDGNGILCLDEIKIGLKIEGDDYE